MSQAALGDTGRVPTLDGEAEIRIPAETQTGKVFRLRDKGVKSVRSRSTGDLYCKAVVETPVNLTPEQRELLDKFEATFVGDGARRHSPKSSTFLDGAKGFWDRLGSYPPLRMERVPNEGRLWTTRPPEQPALQGNHTGLLNE